MRSGLVCLLLAGCNSIFGSHDVKLNPHLDADLTPKDAAPYTMYLTGMNVDTTATPALTFPVLAGATVSAGPFGGTMMPVAINGDGSFTIPFETAQSVYRLIYTPPDGVPVEVQETPQAAHFVVPSIGRPGAVLAPANAMIGGLTPTGGPNTYVNMHVFSIGTFAARISGQTSNGNSIYWSTNAGTQQVDAIVSMSGGVYAPDSMKGDQIVIVDGTADSNTAPFTDDVASGFSVGTMSGFNASGLASPTLTPWQTLTPATTDKLKYQLPSSMLADSPNNRVPAAVGESAATKDADDGAGHLAPFIYAGVVPSIQIPNFIESGLGWNIVSGHPLDRWGLRGTGGLEVPVFLPMSKVISANPASMIRAFDGTTLPAFTPAMYLRYSMTRTWQVDTDTTHIINFTEGIQSVTPVPANNGTATPLAVGIGIANAMALRTTAAQPTTTDIWLQVTSPSAIDARGTTTIDFTYALDAPADDCVATAYRIDGTSLVPVHRFLSANVPSTTPLKVDTSIFDGSHDYVFGVVCHQGLPGVKPTATQPGYDWSQVSYPFSESTMYSYPFHVTVQ